MSRRLERDFFARPVVEVAKALIGAELVVDGCGGVIVETEAYHPSEPAAHSFRGPTPRNAVMFGPPGHAYVYFSYGMHWCLNFVAHDDAPGSAILIRALEPTRGLDRMAERRGTASPRLLCAGPGRLAQALGVTREHNGLPLDAPPFALLGAEEPPDLLVGPRIGISRAVELPWRFGLAGSRALSRRFPAPTAATGESRHRE